MKFALTPDSLFQSRQIRQNANLRQQIETAGQEAITGRKVDILGATNGQTGNAFLLEKASLDITRQRDMATLATGRVSGASESVSTIRESLIQFAPDARVTLALGGDRDLGLMAERAQNDLSHIMGALERRHGTRHLFAGTQSAGGPLSNSDDLQTAINAEISGAADATAAIAAVNSYFNDAGAGFETDIYQGSDGPGPRLHITDSKSFDPLPKADDPVFRDIMQGFALIAGSAEAATSEDRDQLIEAGLNLLDGAVDGILAMESRLGATQQSIERVDEGLQSEASIVSTAQFDLLGRDIFDAAAELQTLQGQLEASYTITGRIGSLSLVNFLR